MTLQSCCCRMLASEALWGILYSLFLPAVKTLCWVVWVPQVQFHVDVVCKEWLLLLLSRWLTRTWGFGPVGPMLLLLPVLWLLVAGVPLSLVVLLLRPAWTSLDRMGPVGPCMLWTCISILRMWHSCHHMLEVSVWVCVLLPRLLSPHLLALPLWFVCVCWVLLRIPQCSGIKSSACCSLLLLGDAPG